MRQQTQSREAREAKLDAIHDQLTKSVAALVTGDDWRRALEFAARFRSRSTGSVAIFVTAECPVSVLAVGGVRGPVTSRLTAGSNG